MALRLAVDQIWPAFALVAGLLLIGVVAYDDGLFDEAAAWFAGLPGGVYSFFAAAMSLVALVTVFLTLDTAVVFVTPVVYLTTERRGLAPEPFLYGTVFMSNAASLLLPGSNLTNLIVLSSEQVPGTVFAARMLPAWIAAVSVTGIVVGAIYRRDLRHRPIAAASMADGRRSLGLGAAATVGATALVLVLRSPALPVLGLGVLTAVADAIRRQTSRSLVAALNAPLLGSVFAVACVVGAAGRMWEQLTGWTQTLSVVASAATGVIASVLVNNLPAASLLVINPDHPQSLLIGLNLGPNLAVTGSLSALLWLQVCRRMGAEVSVWRYSAIGLIVVPLSIAVAIGALHVFAPGGL